MIKIPNQNPQNQTRVLNLGAKVHGSRRTKVYVSLKQLAEQTLEVTLRLPLDDSYPPEAEAQQHFGIEDVVGTHIAVKYTVEMNFDARRRNFDKQVGAIYGDEQNGVLGREELERVGRRHLREMLAPLATLGANIFYHLFLDERNRLLSPHRRHAEIVRATIASVFSRPQLISIRMDLPNGAKSAPLFPWGFLYDDPAFHESDLTKLDPGRFWGFRHQIQEEKDCTATRLNLPANPSVLTSICSHADRLQWHRQPKHSLVRHNGNVTEASTVKEMANALANFTHDCFYFFGHAFQPDPPEQTQSYLKLRGEELTVDSLSRIYGAPRFSKEPVLAFLNGCRTSPLNVWDRESVAGFLCEAGGQSVCCVTTVASVPGSVAATFGCIFWEQFLLRKLRLGDALLRTRRTMLRKWNNPLGLLYTVFGNVDTYVER
jgi:hypothetical protein